MILISIAFSTTFCQVLVLTTLYHHVGGKIYLFINRTSGSM